MQKPSPALRILIADDDALSRQVLTLLLEHAGHQVDAVDSGDAAMQHLRSASHPPPHLVLADIQMPGTSGHALARQLRSLCGPRAALFAMSGSVPATEAIQNFDHFLLKPFTVEELIAAIAAPPAAMKEFRAAASHRNPLDETVYQKLAGSMRAERLTQLYDLTLSDVHERIVRMRQAAAIGASTTYCQQAHAIKGSCGMVGAVELQSLAALSEERGIDANHQASLDELDLAWNRLRRILVAYGETSTKGGAE